MKDIGGYIELEIDKKKLSYHKKALAINSARNGILYAIKAYNIKEMRVPYYTCPVVWQSIKDVGCNIKFYKIDKNLMPIEDFNSEEYILYTNYFGVCDKNVEILSKKYKNIIIDNAQAFFAPPKGIATVYSPRKFFGVPDGGYVYSKKKLEMDFEQDRDSYKYNRCL